MDGGRRYKLSEVETCPALAKALSRSKHGVTPPELSTYIAHSEDVDEEEAKAFIAAMVDCKLLIPELEPGITGEEAFDSMVATFSRLEHKSGRG